VQLGARRPQPRSNGRSPHAPSWRRSSSRSRAAADADLRSTPADDQCQRDSRPVTDPRDAHGETCGKRRRPPQFPSIPRRRKISPGWKGRVCLGQVRRRQRADRSMPVQPAHPYSAQSREHRRPRCWEGSNPLTDALICTPSREGDRGVESEGEAHSLDLYIGRQRISDRSECDRAPAQSGDRSTRDCTALPGRRNGRNASPPA
jgi:hypothetical protein